MAFPKNSKHRELFNTKILEMKENGDLERLGRFWMNGVCKPNEQEKRASKPLYVMMQQQSLLISLWASKRNGYCRSISQFLSAFLLLGIGTAVSVALLVCEHFYMRYLITQTRRGGIQDNGYLSLISTVSMSVYILYNFAGERIVEIDALQSLGKTRYLTSTTRAPAPLVSSQDEPLLASATPMAVTSLYENDILAASSPVIATSHAKGTCRETLSALRRELDRARRQIRVLEDALRGHDGQFAADTNTLRHRLE